MNNVYVIGIAGGSGSGKSTFAHKLKELFKDKCITLSCDDYYYPRDNLTMEERNSINYDAPDSIEFPLLVSHVEQLRDNKEIECPVYDFSNHTRSKEIKKVLPKPVIILDGILLFHDAKLRELIDLKIFVDCDADERILRRALRDIALRGRSFENITEQYLKTVKPMHELYVEPTKKTADIIINGGMSENALELVKLKVQSILKETER